MAKKNEAWFSFLDRFVRDKQIKNPKYSYIEGRTDASPYYRAKCRVTTDKCPSLKKCKLTKNGTRKSYCRKLRNSYKFKEGPAYDSGSDSYAASIASSLSSGFLSGYGNTKSMSKTKTKSRSKSSSSSGSRKSNSSLRRCRTYCKRDSK